MSDSWATYGPDLHLAVTRPRVRESLEAALRDAVHSGRLRAGTRLPSSRVLATDLGIARNTVADVYGQLVAEGWLTAHRGSGTSVAPHPQVSATAVHPSHQAGSRPRFDFAVGVPNVAAFPRAAWLSAARRALATAPVDAFSYGGSRGRPELREVLGEYLARVRSVRAERRQIVVCSGTVQAFSLLCAALRERGATTIAFEALGWRPLRDAAVAQGLRAVTIGVDNYGARIDELADSGADAVSLTPSHQFPTGHVLAPQRRIAVIEWARATGGLIIEDDYDGEFRYDRQPLGSLQELNPDHVAYLGTTSKSLAPGLRLSWAVLPHAVQCSSPSTALPARSSNAIRSCSSTPGRAA